MIYYSDFWIILHCFVTLWQQFGQSVVAFIIIFIFDFNNDTERYKFWKNIISNCIWFIKIEPKSEQEEEEANHEVEFIQRRQLDDRK